MSIDIAVLPETNDLYVHNGDLQLVSDIEHVKQNLKIRLQFYLGEWFLDITQGMPFFTDILVKNPNIPNIDNIMKSRILSTPEITSLLEYKSTFDTLTREYSVQIQVKSVYGEINLQTSLFSSGENS